MNWEQWRTILWLRWRLTRNQWSRFGTLNEVIGILLALGLGLGVIGSCLAGFVLGFGALAKASPLVLLFALDGVAIAFLFFWGVGLLTEIQRSESLDLMRFMHLPVSLQNVFVFNYLVSWFTPSILLFLPASLCLVLGLALGKSPAFLLLAPAVLGFFALITSGTYLLRGWLVSIMANARHRRTVIVVATVIFIGVFQLPNLYFQTMGSRHGVRSAPAIPGWFYTAHNYFPPLWIGQSSRALAEGKTAPALLATAGLFTLAGLGLFRAYRGTLNFYHGTNKVPRATAAPTGPQAPPSRFLERKIPGLNEEAATIALATLRSHLRAPEIKMALFSQVIMIGIFGFMFLRPGGLASIAKVQPFLGAMVVVFSLFGAVQLLFNQFGFDRDGFRAYVLAPLSRRNILLGKNAGVLPFVTALGVLILLLALALGKIGVETFLSALLCLGGGFLLFATLGNLLSIISPFRVAQGSLKPTKPPPIAILTIFLGLLLTPLAAAFIFLPAGLAFFCQEMKWGAGLPINLAGSALILLFAMGLYFGTLGALGNFLQKREQAILLAVTKELQ